MVKPSILGDEEINQLSWGAEVFYRRLTSVLDDYGRFDGRSQMLLAALYPLKLDRVSVPDVVKWIDECREAGLVRMYTVAGRPYVEDLKWDQRMRSSKSKWPSPSNDRNLRDYVSDPPSSACESVHPPSSATGDGVGDGDEKTPLEPLSIGFDRFWEAWPKGKKVARVAALKAWKRLRASEELVKTILDALEKHKLSRKWIKDGGEYIPHPSTWLNQRRWEDEIPETMKSETHEWTL